MAERERTRPGQSDEVTASEAATYACCAKAWHLEHMMGKTPSPQAAERRARGIRQHREHGESMVVLPRGWTRCRAVVHEEIVGRIRRDRQILVVHRSHGFAGRCVACAVRAHCDERLA